jgi:putative FmdB family regulatory protein
MMKRNHPEADMPVYRYVCAECGNHFELWQSFRDADKQVVCPRGHKQTRKVLSVPAVVFKGSGFYVTDHRSKSVTEKSE